MIKIYEPFMKCYRHDRVNSLTAAFLMNLKLIFWAKNHLFFFLQLFAYRTCYWCERSIFLLASTAYCDLNYAEVRQNYQASSWACTCAIAKYYIRYVLWSRHSISETIDRRSTMKYNSLLTVFLYPFEPDAATCT